MCHIKFLSLCFLFRLSALSQTYTIQTFAGGLPQNVQATSAGLGRCTRAATDVAGNVFLPLLDYSAVVRVDPTGFLALVAGDGTSGFGGDNGPATSAQISSPLGIAVDSGGNLYIADHGNNRVRKVSNGVITTVAGNGTAGFSGDNGAATSAQLQGPIAVAVDSAGNLYIADDANLRVRKVSNGVITTVAGTGMFGFSGDNGPATSAQISNPLGIAVDSGGNLYIADYNNSRIRRVSNGVITTVAGNGRAGFSGDGGPATSALLDGPDGVAVDSAGNLYVADSHNNRIRKVSNGVASLFGSSLRVITTVAGNGTAGFSGDNGPATSAQLDTPTDVAVDSAGSLYIPVLNNFRVRKVSNGVITTVAGNGGSSGFGGDDGPATSALLSAVYDAVDAAGNLYIADTSNHRVRRVSNGIITTVAGNGTRGFSGDGGLATSAQLNFPMGLAVDSAGNLYITDIGNSRVRKVSNGFMTTAAGNGTVGFSGDNGTATNAGLSTPHAVAVDSAGNLYISEFGNNRVRKVSNGIITTVAGNGTRGFSGDNGPATTAQLFLPAGLAVDAAGNLYIADNANHRIRKVSNGVITTVAGTGMFGFSGDNGPATSAQISWASPSILEETCILRITATIVSARYRME